MKNKNQTMIAAALLAGWAVIGASTWPATIQAQGILRVNVALNGAVNDAVLNDLSRFGKVRDVIYEINALTLQTTEGALADILSLPYVAAANPDAERNGSPIDTVMATDFSDGMSTWDLDAINVTDFGFSDTRQVPYDGAGVYVAVLDSGLLDSWRQYFPQERFAEEYASCFGGGGGEQGNVSEQPNKWEHDQNSHGTHVTSTILGYRIWGPALGWRQVNGVAPLATVIPVKVLNQNGFGWSSVVAQGIVYVANLKAGPLAAHPVVINMSLGGPGPDAIEATAIDYAISKGVIVVASAGNEGRAGMGYPGAYAPVISVAASGWVRQWEAGQGQRWWWSLDVAEPTNPGDFFIANFSSRQELDQDLDLAAPGMYVQGPWQENSGGQLSYALAAGTSMAAPHVAGIVALMAQKYPALTAPDAEAILEASAIFMAPGSRTVRMHNGAMITHTWGADATGAGLVTADAALAATP